MTQERLNGLASLYTQKDIPVEIDEVITRYGEKHQRQLGLVNILNSNKDLPADDDAVVSEIYSSLSLLITATLYLEN